MTVSSVRTLVVPAAPGAALVWPVALGIEELDYALDLAAPLADIGAVIVSAQVEIAPSGLGEVTASDLSVDGTLLTLSLGPAPSSRTYEVRVSVRASGGDRLAWPILLVISAEGGAYPPTVPPSPGFGPPVTWMAGSGLLFNVAGNSGLLAAL